MNLIKNLTLIAFAAGSAYAAASRPDAPATDPVAFLRLGSVLIGVAKLCFRHVDAAGRQTNWGK